MSNDIETRKFAIEFVSSHLERSRFGRSQISIGELATCVDVAERLAIWINGVPASLAFAGVGSDDRISFPQFRKDLAEQLDGALGVAVVAGTELRDEGSSDRSGRLDEGGVSAGEGHNKVSVGGVVTATVGEGGGAVIVLAPGSSVGA